MCMNGVRINGMITTTAHQLMELLGKAETVRTGCCAAAAGAATRRAVAPRIATGTTPRAGTSTLVSASCSSRSQLAARSGLAYEQTSCWSEVSARGTSASELSENNESRQG